MQNKIFVRNLPFTCVESELGDLFAQYGEVFSAKIAVDRETGRPRGFGFIEMGSEKQAEDAIRELDSVDFGGRRIQVAISEQRPQLDNKRSNGQSLGVSRSGPRHRKPSTAYGSW